MSRNADDGFKLYEQLYNKGVNLVFLKEPHINTETYTHKKTLQEKKLPVQQLILKYSKNFRGIKHSREVIAIINMTAGQNDNARKLHVSPI